MILSLIGRDYRLFAYHSQVYVGWSVILVDLIIEIKMIKGRNSRFVVLLMKEIYSGILKSIQRNNYDVYKQRAHVSFSGKCLIAVKVLLRSLLF